MQVAIAELVRPVRHVAALFARRYHRSRTNVEEIVSFVNLTCFHLEIGSENRPSTVGNSKTPRYQLGASGGFDLFRPTCLRSPQNPDGSGGECPQILTREQFDRVAVLRERRAPRNAQPRVVSSLTLLIGSTPNVSHPCFARQRHGVHGLHDRS